MLTYETLCGRIVENDPWSLARYGDGEWHAILGHKGENCDGHEYYLSLGSRLGLIVRSKPPYYMGLQDLAMQRMSDEIGDWCCKNGVLATPDHWTNADIFHDASRDKGLDLLFDSLQYVNTVIVGPFYLRDIKPKIQYQAFVSVNTKNAWMDYESVVERAKAQVAECDKPTVVLIGCGPMGKVLVDDLYWFTQGKSFVVDVGSLLDPYVGKATRRYHEIVLERLNRAKG